VLVVVGGVVGGAVGVVVGGIGGGLEEEFIILITVLECIH